MIVVVGSANPVKVEGVRRALRRSIRPDAVFPGPEFFDVRGIAVPSGVSEQPMSLEETIRGASRRARPGEPWLVALRERERIAEESIDITVGIESGVFDAPDGRMLDVCACVIRDRAHRESVGLSSSWLVPEDVAELLRAGRGATTMDEAMVATGRTTHERLGYTDAGVIGVLSRGLLTRSQYTEQAVIAALIGLVPEKGESIR